MLWLLIVGVNPGRWLPQAGQAEHVPDVAA